MKTQKSSIRAFAKNSELTEEDALKFGKKVSEKAMKRHIGAKQ